MVKKIFGFSLTSWLVENFFKQPLVNSLVYISAFIIMTSVTVKIFAMIFEYFPPQRYITVQPVEISSCLKIMNDEILNHLTRCDTGEPIDVRKLVEQHAFYLNKGLIIQALAEHIRSAVESIKVKRKDLFMSIYSLDHDNNELDYVLHYDSQRDLVKTKKIPLDDSRYQDYECVKCFNSSDTTAYVFDSKNYYKGSSKRHKTVKHYMGTKLATNGRVFGFLSIEFHNHIIFEDEESMQDFMEENIFPFKMLIEYQYLKHDFFGKFKNFEENWRVA
ncbi:hypothetical protein [uncultured Desulfuromusa sp.]|uniref:hypothetical protein n=1 Tax=uncultured Desulfuromusa sp. TaxID=219183 RepID=UPI002AA80B0A|nr:hypothetical protein [uncultured Desulfuromusa sp.]